MSESSTEKLMYELLKDSVKNVETKIETQLSSFQTDIEEKVERLKQLATTSIAQVESLVDTEKPMVVNLGTVEKPEKQMVHKDFTKIIKILQSTKRKEKNIMLVGGAGGGKTHLAKSIADSIKLKFYPMSVGLQTTKSDLLGFINANGIYMPSPIRLAYENGGLLLLDEFDAAHAGVITILNSLLANGHCSFPDNIVEKHKDFICLCACNTYGKGGTIDYVGRNRLDAATLDRFIVLDVGYDEKLEKLLTNHDKWNKLIKDVRKNIDRYGVKSIVSPRASMDGADLLDAGFDVNEVIDMTIFKGCDDDVRGKLMSGIDLAPFKNPPISYLPSEPYSPIEEKDEQFDMTIYVDFEHLQYKVINKTQNNYIATLKIQLENGMEICVSNSFSEYLNNFRLFLNCRKNYIKKGGLCEDEEYNTPQYIERLLQGLSKPIQSINYPLNIFIEIDDHDGTNHQFTVRGK